MIILLSPSKTLDETACDAVGIASSPALLSQSKLLINKLKTLSEDDVATLMKVSPKLAKLNFDRFQSFSTPFTKKNAKQAILSFKGDVYEGLNAADFDEKDHQFAQNHLRILSGLYGLISPLDYIQPYRLEMGTKLANSKGKNLYEFWGDAITEKLNDDEGDVVINLASNEYFGAVNKKILRPSLITPNFKEYKGGTYKVIGLFAKKARGMMARYIIKNRISDPKELKNFKEDGYIFNSEESNNNDWIFTRKKV